MGGYYLDCADSKAYCGFVGYSNIYGRYYFMACDGTNYWLTKATYDPTEDFNNGLSVFGEQSDDENFPGDDSGDNN